MGDHDTSQGSTSPDRAEREDLTRRKFLQALGVGAAGLGASAGTLPQDGLLGNTALLPPEDGPAGPGPVPITLKVNGQTLKLEVEPRVTLLDALRDHLHAGKPEPIDLTGQKRVCDRASCGACTMMVGGRTVYGCSTLAITAQGKEIRTVEGLEKDGALHPVQRAFVERDGLMCGFCTPGFVMSAVALLEKNPHPKRGEIQRALDGNICRCGTQCRVIEAVELAAGGRKEGR